MMDNKYRILSDNRNSKSFIVKTTRSLKYANTASFLLPNYSKFHNCDYPRFNLVFYNNAN